jgi:hypothetical protein
MCDSSKYSIFNYSMSDMLIFGLLNIRARNGGRIGELYFASTSGVLDTNAKGFDLGSKIQYSQMI